MICTRTGALCITHIYRLTITNPVPSVFSMNFGAQFQISCVGAPLFSEGAVFRISCMLTLPTANRHSFSFICRKYMKQLTLQDVFNEIAKKHAEQETTEMSTLDNPLPSTSSQPDVLSPPSTFPPQIKALLLLLRMPL